jgi:hypothetical protein
MDYRRRKSRVRKADKNPDSRLERCNLACCDAKVRTTPTLGMPLYCTCYSQSQDSQRCKFKQTQLHSTCSPD